MAESQPTIYKAIIVEIRPNLQSVNISAMLNDNICEMNTAFHMNSCQITINQQTINIPLENCMPVEHSLSKVQLSNNSVSLRFSINSDNGSPKPILLQEAAQRSNQDTFLSRDKRFTLRCVNCLNQLSGDVYFTRVLPLPSEHADPSDWFCHGPSATNGGMNLNPKITDIFYTHSYAHLNSNIVKNTRLGNRIIVCGRCLCWLGIVKNPDTMKLWFNTVGFHDGLFLHKTSSLGDVFVAINDVIKQPLINNNKIVFVCESAKDRTDYFLIWVFEKKLKLLLYIDNDSSNVALKETEAAKVMFKFENEKSKTIENWLNDVGATVTSISKPMAHALLTHLYKYNKMIPEEYNHSGEFLISYLLMH